MAVADKKDGALVAAGLLLLLVMIADGATGNYGR
jgi:hypothetical protein